MLLTDYAQDLGPAGRDRGFGDDYRSWRCVDCRKTHTFSRQPEHFAESWDVPVTHALVRESYIGHFWDIDEALALADCLWSALCNDRPAAAAALQHTQRFSVYEDGYQSYAMLARFEAPRQNT